LPKTGSSATRKKTGAPSSRDYKVSSVDRAIDVLESFSEARPELSLTEIVALTGLHKATAFRLLASLRQRNLISKDEVSGRYRLGFRLVAFADIAKAHNGFVSQARAAMLTLCDETKQTVYLSVRIGDHRFDIEQIQGMTDTRLSISLSQPKLLEMGAAGRVMLASLSDEDIEGYLRRTQAMRDPSTEVPALKREILRIRKQGYAASSSHFAMAAVSAPVRGPGEDFLGTISVILPLHRFEEDRDRTAQLLLRATTKVSTALGGRLPAPAF
jgi:IclR family KDG regulon transcriptional repressor